MRSIKGFLVYWMITIENKIKQIILNIQMSL